MVDTQLLVLGHSFIDVSLGVISVSVVLCWCREVRAKSGSFFQVSELTFLGAGQGLSLSYRSQACYWGCIFNVVYSRTLTLLRWVLSTCRSKISFSYFLSRSHSLFLSLGPPSLQCSPPGVVDFGFFAFFSSLFFSQLFLKPLQLFLFCWSPLIPLNFALLFHAYDWLFGCFNSLSRRCAGDTVFLTSFLLCITYWSIFV